MGPGVRRSAILWVNFVRIPTYPYVLVSPHGPDGEEWRTMVGGPPHMGQAGSYALMGSKYSGSLHIRLDEALPTIRHERRRGARQDREISLEDAIELRIGHARTLITVFYVR